MSVLLHSGGVWASYPTEKALEDPLTRAGRRPLSSITRSIHDEYGQEKAHRTHMDSAMNDSKDSVGNAQAPFHIESQGLRALTTHHISNMKKYSNNKRKNVPTKNDNEKNKEEEGDDDPLGQILKELAATAKNLDCARSDLLNAIGLLCHSLLHRGQFHDVLRLQTLLKQGNVPVTPAIFGQILTASVMTRNVKAARDALRDLEEEQGEALTGPWYADYVRQVWDDHLYLALYPLKDFLLKYHADSLGKNHVRAVALACFHIGDKKAAMDALGTLISKEKADTTSAQNGQSSILQDQEQGTHTLTTTGGEKDKDIERTALEGVVQFGIDTAKTRLLSQQFGGRTLRFFNAGGILNALMLLSQEHHVNVGLWEGFLYYLLKTHVVSLPPRELTQSMPASFASTKRESDSSLSVGKIVSMGLEYCQPYQSQSPLKLSPLTLTRLLQMCYTKCNGCSLEDAELILAKLDPDNLSWASQHDLDNGTKEESIDYSDNSSYEVVLRTLVDLAPANHVNTFIEQLARKGVFPHSQKLHRDAVNCLQHSGLDLDLGGLVMYTNSFLDRFVESNLDQLKDHREVGFLKTFGERVKLVTRALMRMNDTERLHSVMAKGIENHGKIMWYIAKQMESIDESNCDEAVWDSLLEVLHAYAAYLEFMDGRGPYAYIHQKENKKSVTECKEQAGSTTERMLFDKDKRSYHPGDVLDHLLDSPVAAYRSRDEILACLLRMCLDCRLNRFLEASSGKLEIAKVVVTALDAADVPYYLCLAEGNFNVRKEHSLGQEDAWKLVDVMRQASHSKLSVFVARRIALYLIEECNQSESLAGETKSAISDEVSSLMDKVVRQFSMESESRVQKHTGVRTSANNRANRKNKTGPKRQQASGQ